MAALVLAAALAACGGGDAGSTAGIDGTGVRAPMGPANAYSFGTVTAFGSVVVNGVHFDTSDATFTIDGESGSQADLAVGDVVLVTGTLEDPSASRGTAMSVVFDDIVQGPIAANSIDLGAGTFVVLGQIVRVTADTSFDPAIQPASLAGLADGDIVEVTGFIGSDGSVSATRLEPKPSSEAFEVTGRAASVESGSLSFALNSLVVDYGSAMLEDFPGGVISNGDLLEVKGTMLGTEGELVATRVEFKGDEVMPAADDDVEIEGIITRFTGPADFDVAGLPVRTTEQTVYERGSAGDLGLDLKVEIEGSTDASGILIADEVHIRRTSALRLAAVIDSVSPSAGSFVTLGITVRVDALTRIEDKRDDVEPFSIATLAPGDYVEVRGIEAPAGSGELLATLIEREDTDPDTDTELRGFVQAAVEPNFTILGVSVTTDGATSFEDAAGRAIPAGTFFGQIEPGTLVDVGGTEIGPQAILAREVEVRQP